MEPKQALIEKTFHFSQFFRAKIREDVFCPAQPKSCDVNDGLNGDCEQICVQDTPLSHHCECKYGFTLAEDGRHCIRSQDCGHVRVDVVFVLDTSNSVHDSNYTAALEMVVLFVKFVAEEVS